LKASRVELRKDSTDEFERFENLGRSQKFNLQRIQDLTLGKFQDKYFMLIYKHTFVEK
jgi:hypothetical protein